MADPPVRMAAPRNDVVPGLWSVSPTLNRTSSRPPPTDTTNPPHTHPPPPSEPLIHPIHPFPQITYTRLIPFIPPFIQPHFSLPIRLPRPAKPLTYLPFPAITIDIRPSTLSCTHRDSRHLTTTTTTTLLYSTSLPTTLNLKSHDGLDHSSTT